MGLEEGYYSLFTSSYIKEEHNLSERLKNQILNVTAFVAEKEIKKKIEVKRNRKKYVINTLLSSNTSSEENKKEKEIKDIIVEYSKKFIASQNNDEKLFSARDIDLKKTNQRGTKLPIQYIRRNDKELQEIITGKKNYNSFRNENTPIKAFKRDFPSFDERKVSKNKYYKIENIKENNINKRPKTATSLHSRNVIKKNIPQIDINKIIEHNNTNKSVDLNNIRIHTESDRYLPKGFLDYHKYITNPNYYKETIDKKIVVKKFN